jgi:hypothetical protein
MVRLVSLFRVAEVEPFERRIILRPEGVAASPRDGRTLKAARTALRTDALLERSAGLGGVVRAERDG